jgi:hypothetical protein
MSVVLFIFKGEKWCEKMQLNPNSRFLDLRFVAFQVYFLWSWPNPHISKISFLSIEVSQFRFFVCLKHEYLDPILFLYLNLGFLFTALLFVVHK